MSELETISERNVELWNDIEQLVCKIHEQSMSIEDLIDKVRSFDKYDATNLLDVGMKMAYCLGRFNPQQ